MAEHALDTATSNFNLPLTTVALRRRRRIIECKKFTRPRAERGRQGSPSNSVVVIDLSTRDRATLFSEALLAIGSALEPDIFK